jgi:hypothetical protein
VRIVVVASPANVNAMVLSQHAPSIPAANITALTRLDHNRAVAHVSGRRGEGEQGFALGHAGTRRAPPPPPWFTAASSPSSLCTARQATPHQLSPRPRPQPQPRCMPSATGSWSCVPRACLSQPCQLRKPGRPLLTSTPLLKQRASLATASTC